MKILTLIGVLVGLTCSPNALAKTGPSTEDRLDTAAYKACLKNTDVETEMRSCADEEIARQNAALNVTYKLVMSKLEPTAQGLLRDGERAWIKQRDRVCSPASYPEEGNAELTTDIAGCQISETETRILYLRKLAH